jgi:nucleoside-diphosphate-sugar epimerase
VASASGLHVVIGAGPLGLAVMRELVRRGRRVRLVSRTGRVPASEGIDVVTADAADPTQAIGACRDATVVFHCAVPPYAQVARHAPALMHGVITGAAAANARVIYGDNLYAYGPVSGPLTEDLPSRAAGPNGRVRAEVAAALMAAHRQGMIRAAIGRASDFYGPHVRQSIVGEQVFVPALKGTAARVLGNPDVPHTYTFIDDFARGLVTLGDRDEALGQVWHVPSSETFTMRQFVQMVFEEAGAPPRLAAAPEWLIALAGIFNPTMRAVAEQAYQRRGPFVVDHAKFARTFGASPTAHREAIRQTLAWYCEALAHGPRTAGRRVR